MARLASDCGLCCGWQVGEGESAHANSCLHRASNWHARPQDMLLSEDVYSVPGLLPAIGRLANAMVGSGGWLAGWAGVICCLLH